MAWLTFRDDHGVRHGRLVGDTIHPVGAGDLMPIVSGHVAPNTGPAPVPLAAVRVLAPLLRPGKVIAVAANYQDHVAESGQHRRDRGRAMPRLFLKPGTSVVGHQQSVAVPAITDQFDWEVELAVVIGRPAAGVAVSDALTHVFGYTTANDLSARRLVHGVPDDDDPRTEFFAWLEGKWADGSAPLGPYLVPADEVRDPQDLSLELTVNGVRRQSGSTADMIHPVAELIAHSSRLMTLEPGDVLLTGTPAGVGMATGTFLQPGDIVAAQVGGFGELRTPIVA